MTEMGNKWSRCKDPFAAREAKKYQNPIPSREFILEYLTKQKKSFSYKQLLISFQIDSAFEKEAFRRRLRAMVRDGQLARGRNGKYGVIQQGELIRGYVIGHNEGFGFVQPEDGTARIFISAREMRQVFDGDLVQVRVIGYDRRHRREGVIAEIIERGSQEIVGRFFVEGGIGFVEPDNKRISQDIIVPPGEQGKAHPGQVVIVKLMTPPTIHTSAIGKVIEILGDYMSPGMEIEIAIRAHALPFKWPQEVIKASEKFSEEVAEKDKKDRADLRHLSFVTIDGEDAKDFDDAVYCEPLDKGGWRLYVAIADVSHYVKPNSVLDKEAIERGSSVYFPGSVIPMLPRVLSNGLCSLKPNVDRLSVVCDMMISKKGVINHYEFYSAVICSQARLTYNKVAALLSGTNVHLTKHYHTLLPHLQELHSLYKILHQKRQERGALDFETTEIKVEFGKGRKINRLVPVVRNDAHKIIEECMLCANVCAAKFLKKNKIPALYRVHDGPNSEKIADLKLFLGELGLKLGGGDLPQPIDYATLLKQIGNRPDAHLIQTVLLRSLSQAFYSPDNDGHFGLAYSEYTHFTSPIRRYPDLIVHRAIRAILKNKTKALPTFDELKVKGEYASMAERRADDATRDALTWLKCEYMQDKIGEEFDGVITSVTGFGIFVELKNIYVEGLIHITKLSGDYYQFDAAHHRLIGTRTHKIYRIGDELRVKVLHVNLEDKRIDFEIVM